MSAQSDSALRARRKMTPGGRVAILALKHGRAPLALRVRMLLPDGRTAAARDVVAIVLRYILETSQADPAKLRGLLAQQVGRKTAEEIMTTAEMLRREGRQEGQLLGKREMLLRQLRQRFGRVPAVAVARVGKARAAELDTWADRVLSAESLAEVIGTARPRE